MVPNWTVAGMLSAEHKLVPGSYSKKRKTSGNVCKRQGSKSKSFKNRYASWK